jgi:hypothetical protein
MDALQVSVLIIAKTKKPRGKPKNKKKQKNQRFHNLLGPSLSPPLRAVGFFGFFGK